jgi:drug/metabolite transporter (DMT)-like permease
VATPLLGTKPLFVAVFTTLLTGQPVLLKHWLGAGLSTLGIAVLHRIGSGHHEHLGLTVICGLLAAVAFGVFDVLVMTWSPLWGAGRFLPIMNLMAAVGSVALIPLFRQPLTAISRPDWRWLLWGAGFIALQGVLLVTTVGVFGDATAINIVYSARGIWSVVVVWLVGAWLGSEEAGRGTSVLRWRLVGAGIMTAGIVTVFS